MTTNAPQIYPLSTQTDKPIPMDVAKPVSCIFGTISAVHRNFVLPANYLICSVYATVDCALRVDGTALPDALVVDTEYPNTMFLQADVQYDLILTGELAVSVLGLTADTGFLRITSLQQWGAFMQVNQANFG